MSVGLIVAVLDDRYETQVSRVDGRASPFDSSPRLLRTASVVLALAEVALNRRAVVRTVQHGTDGFERRKGDSPPPTRW